MLKLRHTLNVHLFLFFLISFISISTSVHAQYTKKVIMVSGQDAPGTFGGVFSSNSTPSGIGLSDEGKAVFRAYLEIGVDGITADEDEGYWVYEGDSVRLLFQENGNLGGFGPYFDGFTQKVYIDPTGQIGLEAEYHYPSELPHTGFFIEENGVLDLKIYEGMVLPTGDILNHLSVRAFNNGRVLFTGSIDGPSSAPYGRAIAVICHYYNGNFDFMYKKYSTATGVDGGPWMMTSADHMPTLSPEGKTIYNVKASNTLNPTKIGINYSWDPINGNVPLRVSGIDSTNVVYGFYRLNSQGNNINKSWDFFPQTHGLFFDNSMFVAQNDIADGADGNTFNQFIHYGMTDHDTAIFLANTSDGTTGIWSGSSAGVQKVVRVGDFVPNENDTMTFWYVNDMIINRAGNVVISDLAVSTDINSMYGYGGIWLGGVSRPLELVVRDDELLEVAPDTFLTIYNPWVYSVSNPRTGADGQPSVFNHEAEFIFSTEFTEGGNALVLAVGPGLIVNSNGDAPDADSTDGVCFTGNLLPDGRPECTLRAAITEANNQDGPNEITFDIKELPIITVRTALPELKDSLLLNGFSQPGDSSVTISSFISGGIIDGLTLSGSEITIQGLRIIRFSGNAISIGGGSPTRNNKIFGCQIGDYDQFNPLDWGNHANGILITNSKNNKIGGTNDWQKNIITNNYDDGINIGRNCDSTKIINNDIGFASGGNPKGNEFNGINMQSSKYVSIINNNIRGNTNYGIFANECGYITIDSNRIGANSRDGIYFEFDCYKSTIIRNIIGLTETSVIDSNDGYGIYFKYACTDNVIGSSADSGNVISGNVAGGIYSFEGEFNNISGNFIGVDITGTEARPNHGNGILLKGESSTLIGENWNNTLNKFIGLGNIISGNDSAGVKIIGNSYDNLTASNLIGVGKDSTTAIPNLWGVYIDSSSNNLIGTEYINLSILLGNVISHNLKSGIFLKKNDSCIVMNNKIQNNGFQGIYLGTSKSNQIKNNQIGSNLQNGIYLNLESNNNNILRNFIGLKDDSQPNGNLHFGIKIDEMSINNLIGGGADSSNFISDNGKGGIKILLSDSNMVSNNFIGTDISGMQARGNRGHGIDIEASSDNVIGSAWSQQQQKIIGVGNIISGNDSAGVMMWAGTFGSRNNAINDNVIGLGSNRVASLPNLWGLYIEAAPLTSIGVANYNTISKNKMNGLVLLSDSCAIYNNAIDSNGYEKTEVYGIFGGDGIYIEGVDNTIKTSSFLFDEQFISYNNGAGIRVLDYKNKNSVGNMIRFNSISGNILGGVDLGPEGKNLNDNLDVDKGPNLLQNSPNLFSISRLGGNILKINGFFQSEPNEAYFIDVYGSNECDPLGLGQGERYLFSKSVFTDSKGEVILSFQDTVFISFPQVVTATATSIIGNTSEFSNCIPIITSGVDLHISKNNFADSIKIFDTLNYEIKVVNYGLDTAKNVTVIDSLLSHISYISDTVSQGSSTYLNSVFSCNIGSLASGEEVLIKLVAKADSLGEIINYAVATTTSSDMNMANNIAVDTTFIKDIATDIDDPTNNNLPTVFALSQNYPNPFNPSTEISFSLPEASDVTLTIFNLLGQEVTTLFHGNLKAGIHTYSWNGAKTASGVYLYKLTADDFVETKKMVLLK